MLLYPGWRSFFSSLFCHALFQLCKFCGTFFISAIDFCLQDSTHLIADVEQILDEVVFLREGQVMLHESVETIRDEKGKSVDELFREVFRC